MNLKINFIEGYVMKKVVFLFAMTVAGVSALVAQSTDSVDVTFYYSTKNNPTVVYLPGEFNAWGHNVSGVIPRTTLPRMTKDPVDRNLVEDSSTARWRADWGEALPEPTNTKLTRTALRQGGSLIP